MWPSFNSGPLPDEFVISSFLTLRVLRVLWFFHAPQKPMSLKSNSSRTENLHENYDCCEIEMKVKTVVASSLNVMFFLKKKKMVVFAGS